MSPRPQATPPRHFPRPKELRSSDAIERDEDVASEYWATLSIYDHRADYFRSSMLLFDRIVMPVPTYPWKDIDAAELDRLSADATWLEDKGCAIRCDWDPRIFDEWLLSELAVSLSIPKTERLLYTRYQLKYLVDTKALKNVEIPVGVTTVPIFGSRDSYQKQEPELLDADAAYQATVELILEAFPVPLPDAPLEDIVRLREQGFVQHQVGKLREWQLELMEDLVAVGTDPLRWRLRMKRAETELRNAIADYTRAMANVLEAKKSARFTTLFSVPLSPLTALGRLFSEHRDDFVLVGQHERSWKALYEKSFAFAGVICTAEEIGA